MIRVLACLAICFSLAAGAALATAQNAATPRPDPIAILAAAKAASGGAAWDALRTQHSKVNISTAGVKGTAERWSDICTGRSLIKYSIGPVAGAAGYDGKNAWSQDGSGQSRAETGDVARELAVNAAYRDKLAFWFPDRAHGADLVHGPRHRRRRRFRRHPHPAGGRPPVPVLDQQPKRT